MTVTFKDLKVGQTFSLAQSNKFGQKVWHYAHYRKVSETEVRCEKDLGRWTLSECGLTANTVITGTIWGA
jgi:hypothetical protein